MTTVAWDGKTLAVDTQQTCDGVPSEIRKLWRVERGGFAAGAGDLENLFLVMEWFNAPDRFVIPKPVIDRRT